MNKKGYTLVELIITIALLSLAATVIVINIQREESRQNNSINAQAIKEIENAACAAIDSLNAFELTGYSRDYCKTNGCTVPLKKIISEGLIDEDKKFDDEGTKIIDIKENYAINIKWTKNGIYYEKTCKIINTTI